MAKNIEMPPEDDDPAEPEYIDEAFEDDSGVADLWENASPFRSAPIIAADIDRDDEADEVDETFPPTAGPRAIRPEAGPVKARPRAAIEPAHKLPQSAPAVMPAAPSSAAVPRQTPAPSGAPPAATGSAKPKLAPRNNIPVHRPPLRARPAPAVPKTGERQPPDAGSENPSGGAGTAPLPALSKIPDWIVLEKLLSDFAPLPSGSLILGVDQAGKPLLVSLLDPSLGSILILGDRLPANRKHLRSILASAEKLNSPDQFQVDVITPEPGAFSSTSSTLRRVQQTGEDGVYDLLGDVLVEVEARLKSRRQLPFQLLVLDQVNELIEQLAEESLRFLRWILRRGPQVGIWPVASIESSNLEGFDLKTFRSFGFRLYGKISEGRTAARFTEIPHQVLRSLSPGSQGCLKLEGDVISFSIPEHA